MRELTTRTLEALVLFTLSLLQEPVPPGEPSCLSCGTSSPEGRSKCRRPSPRRPQVHGAATPTQDTARGSVCRPGHPLPGA